MVSASCKCGYKTSMALGGGFDDFTERNAFPYLCEACSELVVLNAMDPEPRCNQCQGAAVTPYSDPSMFLGQPLHHTVYEWHEHPNSSILRAPSAEAFADDIIQMERGDTDDSRAQFEAILSDLELDLNGLRAELVANYEATWEKVRAGEYYTLYDCAYPCPKCEQRTLHFKSAGCWD